MSSIYLCIPSMVDSRRTDVSVLDMNLIFVFSLPRACFYFLFFFFPAGSSCFHTHFKMISIYLTLSGRLFLIANNFSPIVLLARTRNVVDVGAF